MKKFETLTEIYEDEYLNRYSEALTNNFKPNVTSDSSSNISDDAIEQFIDKERRTKLTNKEKEALKQKRKEEYWKKRNISLMTGKGSHNKDSKSLSKSDSEFDKEENAQIKKNPMGIPWHEDPNFDPNDGYEFPKDYAKILEMDWKFPGDMGRLSYKLYNNIRSGTIFPEIPTYAVTKEDSEEYLKLPVTQMKYVVDTALKYDLAIDDSIWDLLEYKSKYQSGIMHKSAGMDRKKYYGESFTSLSETYNNMYQNMLEGSDLELYNSILLGEALNPDMQVQYDVLQALSNGNNNVTMKLIQHYGALWRNIITTFKKNNRKLSPEDLMKYTTNKTGNDIRNVAKAFRMEAEQSDPQFNN